MDPSLEAPGVPPEVPPDDIEELVPVLDTVLLKAYDDEEEEIYLRECAPTDPEKMNHFTLEETESKEDACVCILRKQDRVSVEILHPLWHSWVKLKSEKMNDLAKSKKKGRGFGRKPTPRDTMKTFTESCKDRIRFCHGISIQEEEVQWSEQCGGLLIRINKQGPRTATICQECKRVRASKLRRLNKKKDGTKVLSFRYPHLLRTQKRQHQAISTVPSEADIPVVLPPHPDTGRTNANFNEMMVVSTTRALNAEEAPDDGVHSGPSNARVQTVSRTLPHSGPPRKKRRLICVGSTIDTTVLDQAVSDTIVDILTASSENPDSVTDEAILRILSTKYPREQAETVHKYRFFDYFTMEGRKRTGSSGGGTGITWSEAPMRIGTQMYLSLGKGPYKMIKDTLGELGLGLCPKLGTVSKYLNKQKIRDPEDPVPQPMPANEGYPRWLDTQSAHEMEPHPDMEVIPSVDAIPSVPFQDPPPMPAEVRSHPYYPSAEEMRKTEIRVQSLGYPLQRKQAREIRSGGCVKRRRRRPKEGSGSVALPPATEDLPVPEDQSEEPDVPEPPSEAWDPGMV